MDGSSHQLRLEISSSSVALDYLLLLRLIEITIGPALISPSTPSASRLTFYARIHVPSYFPIWGREKLLLLSGRLITSCDKRQDSKL